MFNRVRDSIIYPKEIIKYRKDSMFFVIFYLMFFALLLSTRTAIEVARYDGLSHSYKEHIQETMTVVENDCVIVEAVLSCDGEHVIELYEDGVFTVYLDSNEILNFNEYDDGEYAVIIHGDGVYISVYGLSGFKYPISDMPDELHNLDFNDQTLDESVFYETVFTGVDELIISYKGIWGSILIGLEFLLGIVFYLIFVLISSLFLRSRYKFFSYKESFILTTYSSTALFVILTFYYLLDLNLIYLIILILVSFRQNGIMNREIDRQFKNKP